MNLRVILVFIVISLVAGCKGKHLELFPELEDPSLMIRELSVEQMHADIDALILGVLERHPDIEAFADLDKLQSLSHKYKQEIKSPMLRTEFYRTIGKLNQHFNDGHSFLIWPYQELQTVKQQSQLFPFEVVITQSRRILLKHSYRNSDTGQQLSAGTEILAINGVSSNQLIELLQQYSGGETRYLREQVVAYRFSLALWFARGWLNSFDIIVRASNGADDMPLVVDKSWANQNNENTQKAHYYKQLTPDTGLLYLAHFDIDPDKFEVIIDDAFRQIQDNGIKTLVIDIRDNPGGNTDTVSYLSRYLADKPFRLISSMREKLNKDNRGWFNHRGDVGEILTESWDDWQEPIADARRFKGKTYLLIGPISYSSSIVLATTLKDNDFATLVGEASGGYANQTAQGNLFNLPHSQLRAYVATRMLVRPSGDLTRKGVEPHHTIIDSLKDIKMQNDAAIEFVINHSKRN